MGGDPERDGERMIDWDFSQFIGAGQLALLLGIFLRIGRITEAVADLQRRVSKLEGKPA